ncbi:MAG: antibiotic biosynthesis monooxygenase [Polyangiaceae bacterium]
MIIVVSQAWTKDEHESADAYVEQSRIFLDFMKAAPGFRGRKLVRSLEDKTHFTNLRWFDDVAAYESMTQHPDYQKQISALSEHLDLTKYAGRAGREYMQIVLDD